MKIIGRINARGLNRSLITGRRSAERLDPALNSIANLVQSSIEQNFEDEGRPSAWKALKKATLQARARKGKTGKILSVSGQLRSSINTRVERNVVIAGSNKTYARAMDQGNPKNNTPARNFLLFQKEDVKESEEILIEHLLRGLR